jgi:Fe-S cluster assembly iron-binding protein IscA
MFHSVFANNSVFNLHFMKVSTENDNNFGYEKITILVDNMPLNVIYGQSQSCFVRTIITSEIDLI